MASNKTKNIIKEKLTLLPRFPAFVGYADYFLKTAVSVQITSGFSEAVRLTVSISDTNGLIVPYEAETEVPFESSVELRAEGIFSPLFLAENNELRQLAAEVVVSSEGKELKRE